MDKLLIQGGRPLSGEVSISGAKNAALPILCAALLSAEPVRFSNVPHLNDISTMLRLIGQMGVEVTMDGNDRLILDSRGLNNPTAPYDMVKTMRASILVLGPMLARFGVDPTFAPFEWKDPQGKLVIFSDGLDVDKIRELFLRFNGRVKVSFGWGTLLTNDFRGLVPGDGLAPFSLVCKAVAANGRPTVKLSDNPEKATGPKDEIARYRRVFETGPQERIAVLV